MNDAELLSKYTRSEPSELRGDLYLTHLGGWVGCGGRFRFSRSDDKDRRDFDFPRGAVKIGTMRRTSDGSETPGNKVDFRENLREGQRYFQRRNSQVRCKSGGFI